MDEQAKEYARYLYEKMRKVLGRKAFRDSGELLDSLQTSFTQSTEGDLPVIHLRFAIHGKFIDIKKMYWTQVPPVAELVEWLGHGNKISRFTRIPGYKEGSAPFSQRKAEERVAWAIAMKRRFNDSYKSKKWKRKPLGEAIRYLTHLVAENFAEFAAGAVAETINKQVTRTA